jgi:hypothetical protein
LYTDDVSPVDPWRTLSVASVEDGAPKRSPTTTVPAFDGKPSDSQFYGAIYTGQVHAVDFFSSTGQPDARNQAFKTGLGLFTTALDQWLPNFKAGSEPVLSSATGTVSSTAARTDNANAAGSTSTSKSGNGAASVGVQSSLVIGAAIVAVTFMR